MHQHPFSKTYIWLPAELWICIFQNSFYNGWSILLIDKENNGDLNTEDIYIYAPSKIKYDKHESCQSFWLSAETLIV